MIFVQVHGHFPQQLFKLLRLTRLDGLNVGLVFGELGIYDLVAKFSLAVVALPVTLQLLKAVKACRSLLRD